MSKTTTTAEIVAVCIGDRVPVGPGVWVKLDHNHEVASWTRSDEHPGEGWYPNYATSRVHGSSYRYYPESSEWAEFASAAMSRAAQSNFARGH